MLTRRSFLTATGTVGALGLLGFPKMAFAAAKSERRFVFIIQRGAADGLNIVAPTGDPAYAPLRADFAPELATGMKLNSFFTLHPALEQTGRMFGEKQALFVHAVASPYRDRSHFDGQNVLETGGSAAYRVKDGWLNRLLDLLPPDEANALALSSTVPMALRGRHEVSSYAIAQLPKPTADLLARVGALYESDHELHGLWTAAMETRMKAGDSMSGAPNGQKGAATGALAAKMLLGDGARVAMIETNGWDTHSGQRGRLAAQLRELDQTVAALKAGLGTEWSNTLVVVATEFGRTARPNGTGGTDHGQGSSAMLLGGAVAGGTVIADWPGLADANLYEGRDLQPTIDLDALIAGALSQHYALEPGRVMTTLFPDSRGGALRHSLVLT
ncbi:MAG TPA: DUF1501 domain-containing protein [Sphingomicrobium sp.]|nr:DUF1501 domain-containing protein [Sphingomicrobium sp.]